MISNGGAPESDRSAAAQRSLSDIRENIRNAQLLLSYASEAGINVEPEVIRSVVEFKNACESDTPPVDPVGTETRFWQATEKLAKSVSPVTVASLRASYDIQEDSSIWGLLRARIFKSTQKISQAKLTVRSYRFGTLITLAILVTVHVYWIVGASATTEVASYMDQQLKAQDEKTKLERELKSIMNSLDSANINAVKRAELEADREEKLGIITGIDAKLDNYRIIIEANYRILDNWLKVWRWLPSFPQGDDEYKRLILARTSANYALHAIQVYLLPILYGLLGAITYVLRILGSQIKNLCYTSESNIGYRLRMVLGALAGLSIAWFVQPAGQAAESKAFATLSPFAIAFLAGYGVELLFAAMDRLIGAFTGNSAGK
jgi:hypothetical protein